MAFSRAPDVTVRTIFTSALIKCVSISAESLTRGPARTVYRYHGVTSSPANQIESFPTSRVVELTRMKHPPICFCVYPDIFKRYAHIVEVPALKSISKTQQLSSLIFIIKNIISKKNILKFYLLLY